MEKSKILLLFPDGVGIRNYLYSDVFKDSDDELVLMHSFDSKTASEIKSLTGIQDMISLPEYRESLAEKVLRELICLSRLKYNSKQTANYTILKNWNRNHKSISKKVVYRIIEFLAPFVKSYKAILYLEKVYQKEIRKNEFYRQIKVLLEKIQPDKLFCSHQRGIQCAPFFAAATDLNIQTTTVIFSWDNLPKARMALRADYYWVWSDYMKEEMKIFYPEIPQESVIVTGTPQFEFYRDAANIIPREVFYEKYGLDATKKIICFSGDDALTSPDDPKYLNDLAEELVSHKLDKDFQILLRRCPVDLSNRFAPVLEKFPQLIKEAPPIWNFKDKENWTTVYALPEDVKLLVSTVYYCDVVVNLGSTMAFDFAMFEKPCIFINYDQEIKNVPDWSVKEVYKFQHFSSMTDPRAVIWWNHKEEISEKLNTLNKDTTVAYIREWKNKIIGNFGFEVFKKI